MWIPLTQISVQYHDRIHSASLHLHEYFELEIVLDGEGGQNLNGSLYPIGPGTVYLITPIDFHSITAHAPLSVCNISFMEGAVTPEQQMELMNRRSNLIFSSPGEAELMLTLAKRLEEECRRCDAFAVRARKDILELLLISVARQGGAASLSPAAYDQPMQNAMQYLFRHFREDVSLKEIAAQSGYTPNYFSALFHRNSGQRLVDFLTRLRLNYARALLLSSNMPIDLVAQKSGFSSSSNFHRAFRREMGVSPLEYRSGKSYS